LAEALHLQELVSRARQLGALSAAPLPAAAVVVDERVRLKCRVPLCSHYGHNLMCPPNVMAPDETGAVLRRYDDVLVVQGDIPVTQQQVTDTCEGLPYAEAHGRLDGLGALRDSQNDFMALMTALESDAFKMGYRYAAAFSGGECVLCEECVGQASDEPCRHPFAARPSMEAVGIDVVATAEAAGLHVELPAEDHPRWTGLLLID
jgi:predicted metal-binding protein